MDKEKIKLLFHWTGIRNSILFLTGVMSFASTFDVKAAEYHKEDFDREEKIPVIMSEEEYSVEQAEEQYQISYDANGGEGTMEPSIIPYNGAALRANCFTKTGHTFMGWALSPLSMEMFQDGAYFFPYSDTTLYAVWEANRYTVTLKGIGVDGSDLSSVNVYGSTVSIDAGTRTGYHFRDWTVEGQAVSLANPSDSVTTFLMPDEEVCLTANWEVNQYQVVVSGTGQGGTDSETADYQSTVTIKAGTKEGYTFCGWKVKAGEITLEDTSALETTFIVGESNVEIEAIWQANTYTVRVIDGGDGSVREQSMTYGTTVTVNAGSKNGSYFCGWEMKTGLDSLDHATEEEVNFIMPASDVELKATWKQINGMQATLNDLFHQTYDIDAYWKDGCYNVGKSILITKEFVDVEIQFSDGSVTLAKENDYTLKNAMIHLVGVNLIEVVLTAGNSNIIDPISLMGYSPGLDAMMEELGLAKDDYDGLVEKIEQMRIEIEKWTTERLQYEQNLVEIKQLLSQVEIDTNLAEELEERLQNTQNSVKEAVECLQQKEEERIKLETIIFSMIDSLDKNQEEYEKYKKLSEILQELQQEIDKTKKNETILLEEFNQIAKKLGIMNQITSNDMLQNTDFFDQIEEKIEDMEEELETCKEAIERLQGLLGIVNTSSLKSQLDEIFERITRKLTSIDDFQTLIEQRLGMEHGEDTKETTRIAAILEKIYFLQSYANHLQSFHHAVEEAFGLKSDQWSDQEIIELIEETKKRLLEYDQFLDRTEELIHPEGVNGSGALTTGEETKKELKQVFIKIEDMQKQLELLEKMLPVLLEREEISVEDVEDLKKLLEQVVNQKETTNYFLNSLKELLELNPDAGNSEIYQKVSAMKDTLAEYWNYLGEVENLLQMDDEKEEVSGIATGSAVTVRLTGIYDKLTDMIEQQKQMEEMIQNLLNQDHSSETIKNLEMLLKEMTEQKQQADYFLQELRRLLDLDEDAGYQDIIDTVSDMKNQFHNAVEQIEEWMRQLGIEEDGPFSENLKTIFQHILELINQLAEEMKKVEETEKKVVSLNQQIQSLVEENQKYDVENNRLQKEIEQLKKKLSSVSCSSSDSSSSFDDTELRELERKNQLQQDKIEELEKRLQLQNEETEKWNVEKKQILETISRKEQKIQELQDQIELLRVQLREKERNITELENKVEQQKSIKELLEQNQIDYEQLVFILKEREEQQKIPVVELETTMIQKNDQIEEKRTEWSEENIQETAEYTETMEILDWESIGSETKEIESSEEKITKSEESTFGAEETSPLETNQSEEELQKEEKKENKRKIGIYWSILLLLVSLLSGVILWMRKKDSEE